MAEAIVAIIVEMSTFCHPPSPAFFSLRAQIQVAKTKMKLSMHFKFEVSLGIIF